MKATPEANAMITRAANVLRGTISELNTVTQESNADNVAKSGISLALELVYTAGIFLCAKPERKQTLYPIMKKLSEAVTKTSSLTDVHPEG